MFWNEVRNTTEMHMSFYQEVVSAFQKNPILYHEAKDSDEQSLEGSDLRAIKELQETVDRVHKLCEKELGILEKETKDMIELVSPHIPPTIHIITHGYCPGI